MKPVLWAQRANIILLTLEIEDCKNPTVNLEANKLHFKGKSDSIRQEADHNEHEVTIEFYKPINVEQSKHAVRARGIEFVLTKEEPCWWPRLLKDTTKHHWLKVDFPKWKDEDDSEDEMGGPGGAGGQPDFSELMQQFGGFGGAGGDAQQWGSDGEEEEEDDDTEQTPPDLEEANRENAN